MDEGAWLDEGEWLGKNDSSSWETKALEWEAAIQITLP